MLVQVAVALFAAVAAVIPARTSTPPGIPCTSRAKRQLNNITVAASGGGSGYDRDLFPHWSSYSGSCNTREYVLQRDGRDVEMAPNCAATSGTWYSPFDGATWHDASEVDVDHMVPLKNAWISGASSWSTSKRRVFANDVAHPQLWAVTSRVNSDKSDQSPDSWKPPLKSFYCTYAKSWIAVKHHWDLTITSAEKSALSSMLGNC